MLDLKVAVDVREWDQIRTVWSGPGLEGRLHGAAEEAGALVKSRAVATAPVGAFSTLRGSHDHKVVRLNGLPTAIVSNSALHAIVIHEGRRPGKRQPPTSRREGGRVVWQGPLVPWMKFKRIPLEMEWVIARAIGRKGIKARPWLFKAAEDSQAAVVAVYNRWLAAP